MGLSQVQEANRHIVASGIFPASFTLITGTSSYSACSQIKPYSLATFGMFHLQRCKGNTILLLES